MSYSKSLNYELSILARELLRADQTLWKRFMQLLATRVDETSEEIVKAATADIHVAQGRAREIRDLFRVLDQGPAEAERIEQQKANLQKGQPNGRGSRTNPAIHF